MKDILDKFDIELSEKTEHFIEDESEIYWEDFRNNGDMENDKAFCEMSDEEKFKYAFRQGYWDAMMELLLEEAEGKNK